MRRILLLVALCMPGVALASSGVTVVNDKAAFLESLHQNRYTTNGGIDAATVADSKQLGFPHFSSSFTTAGVAFPYTMLGYPPASGKTAVLKTVIVPVRLRFTGLGTNDIVFEPGPAVDNILRSPIFNDARFANGTGQFGDQLQRATFWNKMDAAHRWHVKLATPRVLPAQEIIAGPDHGSGVFQVGPNPTDLLGQVDINTIFHQTRALVQSLGIQADEVPIFVTWNSFADVALGYHDAYHVAHSDGSEGLQTLIYTSWLDGNLVGSLLADISTLNHEVGEWLNDPYVNNIVPTWMYPPNGDAKSICSDNPFLEVGDPQGNGPTYYKFPTVPITLNGFTYHLQDLVMLPWFADEVPSSAQNGWYDFPSTAEITAPAQYCPN